MNPKRPWECADMSQVRAEIDRIDATLVDLIAERFGYVDRAWQLKKDTPEGAVVNWRIQQVIDRVKARAKSHELPPDIIDMIGAQWKNMIGWFVQYEEEKMRQGSEGSGDANNNANNNGKSCPPFFSPTSRSTKWRLMPSLIRH